MHLSICLCRKIYEISVEPEVYGREIAPPPTQRLQVIIPGSVDAPEIFLRTVNEKDFTIEWGEPRHMTLTDGYN